MVVNSVNISNLTQMSDLTRILNPFCSQVGQALQSNVTFQDNMRASVVVVQFPSIAAQNIQVTHGLNATPIGYMIARSSTFCMICDGNKSVIGPTFVNLKCSVAGVTSTIVFF